MSEQDGVVIPFPERRRSEQVTPVELREAFEAADVAVPDPRLMERVKKEIEDRKNAIDRHPASGRRSRGDKSTD